MGVSRELGREGVRALLERGEGAEVRTARGSWRAVVAVYSDQTLGTIRAEGVGAGGRFTIVDADRIADVRAAQTAPSGNGSRPHEPADRSGTQRRRFGLQRPAES